jgi:membrane-associated protease RseP (regulator of RpoE activity)
VPFWSRRPPEEPPSWEEMFPVEAQLRSQLDDVLIIRERRLVGRSVVFGGTLLVEPSAAVERLRPRLARHGYTPFLREDAGLAWVHAIAQAEVAEPSRPLVHLGLFLATIVTTLLAGTLLLGGVPFDELWQNPGRILVGLPFAASLLGILGVHEFGHYALGRRHGLPVSLPYFIPVPPVPPFLLGTMGAVIRLRGAIRDRRALFDMAVAGPLAGLVVAIPIYVLGLKLSSVVRIPEGTEAMYFGDALLPKLLERLIFGPLPPGADIMLHPVGVAAWFGFFVTALNLIPAGQLDGGHIVYALFGGRHALVSKLAVGGLVVIGLAFGSINWLVWAALIVGVMGFRHAPTMDDITPLDGWRRALGLFALILLALLLPPVPLSMH